MRVVGGAYPLINPDAADLGGAHVRVKVHQFSTTPTIIGYMQHPGNAHRSSCVLLGVRTDQPCC